MFAQKKHLNRIGPLALTLALANACSSDDPVVEEPDVLIWRSCTTGSTLQCAELKVPTAYDDESAGEITIGLNRLQATTQPARGSLLFNPGGPGGSGTDLLESFAEADALPGSIRAAFDLVGFDPRGIGESTPLECEEFGLDELNDYPTNRADIDEFVAQMTQITAQCQEKYGDYLLQLGSLNVVRDMNSIRQALQEDKLHFIGYSYGTRLAGLYLQNFPEHSGQIVLDGSIKPDSAVLPLVEGSLPVLQSNFESLLAQCTRVTPECNVDDLLQRLEDKVETFVADENSDEFGLVGQLVLLGAQDPEFGDFLVAPLVSYLINDDIQVLEDFVTFLNDQGVQLAEEDDGDGAAAQLAVLCADDAARPTADELDEALQRFNSQSDLFAEASLPLAASCTGWPDAIEPLPIITTRTAPESLVIGGTTDAQTPLAWSEEMATSIGGYYLPSSHDGHTSVFNGRSDCVDEIVVDFLLNNQLPESGDCLAASE